jgi:hypothetical protein
MDYKLVKTREELYKKVLDEIVSLVKFEEHCKSFDDEMPEQEKGRLKAFRDVGLFLSSGKEWGYE